jgi:hypothetical protein
VYSLLNCDYTSVDKVVRFRRLVGECADVEMRSTFSGVIFQISHKLDVNLRTFNFSS